MKKEREARDERNGAADSDPASARLPDEPSVEEYIGEKSVWSEDISEERENGDRLPPRYDGPAKDGR